MFKQRKRLIVKVSAIILALLWSLLWLYLGLTQSTSRVLNWSVLLPGVIFLFSTLLSFKWELVCSVVLITEAVTAAISYIINVNELLSPFMVAFTIGLLSLPPLISGVLLVLAWRWKEPPVAEDAEPLDPLL